LIGKVSSLKQSGNIKNSVKSGDRDMNVGERKTKGQTKNEVFIDLIN
jgi:hypothetical protein